VKKQEIIAKITEIRDKRTHCQCSRAKVVEKAYFDRIIKEISALPEDSDPIPFLQHEQTALQINNDDLRIRYNAYGYAIMVCKKYAE